MKQCSDCLQAKTRVFWNVSEYLSWMSGKTIKNCIAIPTKFIRRDGKVRVYWCDYIANPRIYVELKNNLNGGKSCGILGGDMKQKVLKDESLEPTPECIEKTENYIK